MQYNREQSNKVECNTMPCINLSEYWTILPSSGAYSQAIVQNNFFNSVLYTPKFLINLMICRVNNVLHDVQCNAAFLCCITEINVGYWKHSS